MFCFNVNDYDTSLHSVENEPWLLLLKGWFQPKQQRRNTDFVNETVCHANLLYNVHPVPHATVVVRKDPGLMSGMWYVVYTKLGPREELY